MIPKKQGRKIEMSGNTPHTTPEQNENGQSTGFEELSKNIPEQ